MTRKSAFAGTFYPSDKNELERAVKHYIDSAVVDKKEAMKAVSYVAPHAGYAYSGSTAGYTYKALSENRSADTFIIVGPNHTGIGTRISVSLDDWETPLGKIETDKEFAKHICGNSEIAAIDETAHMSEHSIEVQLPFMQSIGMKKAFVFVCMGDQGIEASNDLAGVILKTETQLNRKCAVIASSDFNHYESAEAGKEKDMKLIKALESIDYEKFNRLVAETNDSVCGYGPITVAAIFAKQKGATKCILLNYSNSGSETRDLSSVVDYASLAFL